MQGDDGLAIRIANAAMDRYEQGHPEPGDGQIILSATLHQHQHQLGTAVEKLTGAVEELTTATTSFIERAAREEPIQRRLRDRARSATPPVIGLGALAAVISWVMNHSRL